MRRPACRTPLIGLIVGLVGSGGAACDASRDSARLSLSVSALGAEGAVIRRQLERFRESHPDLDLDLRVTPDAADQRHQLYVQWLNARVSDPDIVQLDVIWTAEFAAAGWLLPMDPTAIDAGDFVPAALESARWGGTLFAAPWFIDLGLLYWRTDLMNAPPDSLAELRDTALRLTRGNAARFGLVWQGARYEGLLTVFLEHLAAFGGGILDDRGGVIVDRPPAVRALTFMRDAIRADGWVPASVLAWQEEQVRFAFQNGNAAFMRNWPYAAPLLDDGSQSAVAGRFAVAPFPADGGLAAAALGGSHLAVSAWSENPGMAMGLVRFLTAPEQMLERARVASQLPARRSLYQTDDLAGAMPVPIDQLRRLVDAAVARPATPVYSELSEILQVRIHRALSGQQSPADALRDAAREARTLLARTGLGAAPPPS